MTFKQDPHGYGLLATVALLCLMVLGVVVLTGGLIWLAQVVR